MKDDILQAAKTVFLREGYGASISKIIEEAGIARQSIYNHFENKQSLFNAVVQYVVWQTMGSLLTLELPSDLPLRKALLRFGSSYMDGVLHPDNLALTRVIGAASMEVPEIGAAVFQTRRSIPMLAAYLKAQHDRGKIECPLPDMTADSFAGALVGPARYRHMINVDLDMSPTDRRAYLREVTRIYVDGLRPRGKGKAVDDLELGDKDQRAI